MDFPYRIPPSGTPAKYITNPDYTVATVPGQVQDTTIKTGTGKVISHHNDIFTDIAAQVIMTHVEAAPGHDTGIITTTLEVAHNAHAPHIETTAIDPLLYNTSTPLQIIHTQKSLSLPLHRSK